MRQDFRQTAVKKAQSTRGTVDDPLWGLMEEEERQKVWGQISSR